MTAMICDSEASASITTSIRFAIVWNGIASSPSCSVASTVITPGLSSTALSSDSGDVEHAVSRSDAAAAMGKVMPTIRNLMREGYGRATFPAVDGRSLLSAHVDFRRASTPAVS
jgi:hypothetical protein